MAYKFALDEMMTIMRFRQSKRQTVQNTDKFHLDYPMKS